jgi:hypothetical protein
MLNQEVATFKSLIETCDISSTNVTLIWFQCESSPVNV